MDANTVAVRSFVILLKHNQNKIWQNEKSIVREMHGNETERGNINFSWNMKTNLSVYLLPSCLVSISIFSLTRRDWPRGTSRWRGILSAHYLLNHSLGSFLPNIHENTFGIQKKCDWILLTLIYIQGYLGHKHNWAASWQNQQNGLCAQRRLRSAWASESDQSSLSAWRKLWFLATHWAHSEDSDPTGRMPRLIRVFAGRTCHIAGFVMRRLISRARGKTTFVRIL